ncbi:MAG: putative methylase [Candidatus Aminicenantes bacterium]|nr:putative methylase [Candidatus Aminicenantes bacterium]
MLKRNRILAGLTLWGFVSAAQALAPAAAAQRSLLPAAKKETTIRNLTKETVRYTIRRLVRDQQPFVRYLKPDALDRWPCESPLDVGFDRSGQPTSYRLECGLPYTFRYDESDMLDLYSGSHGLFGVADLAPFVPTPMAVVEKMLELGEVDKDDILYDLGCGDGRIVITAAQKFGTRGVGIDIDPQRIEESRRSAKEAGVDGLLEFRLQDVMKAEIRQATVVTLYLLPESNALLRPLLEEQLRPGTPVVSHNYSIPGWAAKEVNYVTLQDGTGQDHTIFVYKR